MLLQTYISGAAIFSVPLSFGTTVLKENPTRINLKRVASLHGQIPILEQSKSKSTKLMPNP